MSAADLFDYVKNGGAYCAPLLLLALYWVSNDRTRLLRELRDRNQRLDVLADRAITVMAELKTFLFSERKS